jgi:phosphatidylglycerophosphate synthase
MKLVDYKYQCDDRSILLKPFKKWLVSPVFRLIPWGLPANIITITSNIFLYFALYLAVSRNDGEFWPFPVIGLLIYLYNLGDHLDGMQAKHTSTGSRLGEFCDHFLDGFNDGIILIIIMSLFQVSKIFFAAAIFTIFYIAHASVMYEEYKTKWLVFEKLGSLESIFLAVGLIGFSAFQPVYTFLTMHVWQNFSVIEICLMLSAFGTMSTFVRVGIRAKGFSLRFYLFLASLITIAVTGVFLFSNSQLFCIMTIYSGSYIGLVMRGHLVDGKERFPDFIVPAGMIVSFVLLKYGFYPYSNFSMIMIYISAYTMILIVSTVYPLRKCWVWINPSKQSIAGKKGKR